MSNDIEGEIEGETEYELEVLSVAWSQDHTQQTIEFKVHGAPVYSYSAVKDGPILRAVVKLQVDTSKRLASGTGSALAKTDSAAFAQTFGSPMGSDYTEAEGVPREPTREQVLDACRGALRRHLVDVREENARAGVRERQTESLVGQRMKVRT